MDRDTVSSLMQAIAPVMRQYLNEQLAPVLLRLQAIEARAATFPETGPAGRDGLSMIDALIDAEKQLCLTRSDGVIARLGRVVGKDGRDGTDGRGIVRAAVDGDHLTVVYSDGVLADAGEVRGPPGLPGESIKGDKGDPGRDGTDADPALVRALVDEAFASMPRPRDGRDGIDGRSVEPEFVRGMVAEAVAAIPAPKDGEKGDKGDPGESIKGDKGDPGRDGADADPALVRSLVAQAVAEIPKPRDGVDGQKGDPGDTVIGPPGPPGESIKGDAGPPGRDGLDADPEQVRALVAEAIAAIPAPRDGVDGKDADPDVIRSLVSDAVSALPAPRDGHDGADGKDADPAFVKALVAEAVAAIPAPKDGEPGAPGRDGADADPEVMRTMVAEAIAAIPAPRDGDQGPAGPPGRDGTDADATRAIAELDARISDRITQLREWTSGEIADAVGRAIAASDAVKLAVDAALATVPKSFVVDGSGDLLFVRRDGTTERIGHVRGEDGKTPPGVDHFTLDEDGNLTAHMTDGRSILVGRVRGTDGKDGVDGRDGEPGLGFDDMDSAFDGERTVTMRWTKDGRVNERAFRLAVPIYRKVWKQDVDYEVGDMVTYAGGLWTCVQPTKNKPGDGEANGWQLAVKGAKNGKSTYELARAEGFRGTEKEWLASLKGPEGKPGPMGPPGRDRT